MRRLLVLGMVGCVAQLVDGSTGMGYGLTSGTLLLCLGLSPAAVSASVHLSELATNVVSAVSHWRLGNVEWRVVGRLAVPGVVGALGGAAVLSAFPADVAAPVMAAVLTVLGGYVLVRTVRGGRSPRRGVPGVRLVVPLGVVAGFVDATGSGGWGPIATPALLAEGRLAPRRVIGSVDTSEFAVSLAASVGLLVGLGGTVVQGQLVAALMLGGIVAAPLAASLVRVLPAAVLGVVAGGMIVGSNLQILLLAGHAAVGVRLSVDVIVVAAVAVLLVIVITRGRSARRAASQPTAQEITATDVMG